MTKPTKLRLGPEKDSGQDCLLWAFFGTKKTNAFSCNMPSHGLQTVDWAHAILLVLSLCLAKIEHLI